VARWLPVLKPVESGRGRHTRGFDVAGGKATNVVADLELTRVRARGRAEPAQLDPRTSANVT
jgi:hypothetical protein